MKSLPGMTCGVYRAKYKRETQPIEAPPKAGAAFWYWMGLAFAKAPGAAKTALPSQKH